MPWSHLCPSKDRPKWPCSTSPTTPLSTHQSIDLGELYNFVVGVEVNGWSFVYGFGRSLRKSGLISNRIFEKCINFLHDGLLNSIVRRARSRDLDMIFQRSTQISKTFSPTTPLSTHQSIDLGELYNFVAGVEVNGWSFVYDFGRSLMIIIWRWSG